MRRVEEFWIEFNPSVESEEPKAPWAVSLMYDAIESVKGAVIVVFLIFAFVFRAVGVDGDSMYPTLKDGDWVAVSGVTAEVDRGDIIVSTQPWERNVPIVKRVIAVGGDTVYIDFDNNAVYVNGEKLYEPYIAELTRVSYDVEFPITVDEGKLFVMGDNRNISLDSRSSKIGLIDERYVLGKVLFRVYPSFDGNF